MKKTFDILIFSGQSNMQGQTEGLPEHNPVINTALEYHSLSDTFIPLMHPVGEDIGDKLLCAAHNGCGTLVPAFCRTYSSSTNHDVIAVHAARGDTTISEWLPETDRYTTLTKKISGAVKKASKDFNIGKIYFIWLQGESDAIAGTSAAEYEKMLISFKNSLFKMFDIEKFCLIEMGYFCRIAPWLEYSRNGEGILRDEEIMHAQEHMPKIDSDFVILTDICKTICLDSEYMNPFVGGHYNNKGMDLIGETAGKALAELNI